MNGILVMNSMEIHCRDLSLQTIINRIQVHSKYMFMTEPLTSCNFYLYHYDNGKAIAEEKINMIEYAKEVEPVPDEYGEGYFV